MNEQDKNKWAEVDDSASARCLHPGVSRSWCRVETGEEWWWRGMLMEDSGWGGGAGTRDQTLGRCKVLETNGKPKEMDGLRQ